MNHSKITVLIWCFLILFSCKEEQKITFNDVNISFENNSIVVVNIPEAIGNSTIADRINSEIEQTIISELHIGNRDDITSKTIKESILNFNNEYQSFVKNFPESEYGPKLLAEVEKIDETIRQDYDNLYDNVTRQVAEKARLAVESYNIVGFPMKYTEISPTDPNIMRQELIDINQFLDRAGMFGKTYAEFKEYYEANEDMARIAGKPVSQELEDMMSKQIAPRYQAYDNFRGEVRRILEASPVVPELKFIKEQIWLKTM